MKIDIYPSLLAAPLLDLRSVLGPLAQAGCKGFHIDVMDGHFVPNMAMGPDIVRSLKQATPLELDVHIMVEKPEQWVESFAQAGADHLTFHTEATVHGHRLCQAIRMAGMRVGVAINPGTAWQTVEPLLPFVDRVLVMTVNPGFCRQSHILSMHEKISALHQFKTQKRLTFDLQIDGGINIQNAHLLRSLGANSLVVGGALFDTTDWAHTIAQLAGQDGF